jgi:double-stranded RNA-binding protein Staufen
MKKKIVSNVAELMLCNKNIAFSAEEKNGTVAADSTQDDDLKSEISLVHEIALRRNLSVNFEVVKESGPPHLRTFVTRCTCGTFVADGVGNSKKLSKKRCAEKILEELRGLPAIPPPANKARKQPINKKKNRNLIKVLNEISMLWNHS